MFWLQFLANFRELMVISMCEDYVSTYLVAVYMHD